MGDYTLKLVKDAHIAADNTSPDDVIYTFDNTWSIPGETQSQRSNMELIPHKDGANETGDRKLNNNVIEITGLFRETTANAAQVSADSAINILNTYADSHIALMITRNANPRVKKFTSYTFDRQNIRHLQQRVLQCLFGFNAADPLWYGPHASTALTVDSNPDTMSVTNAGTRETMPVIKIVVTTAAGAAFTVNAGGRTATITDTLAGNTYIIDCQEGLIYKAGAVNMAIWSGQFPKLNPGANTVTIAGLTAAAVTVYYRPAYI